MDRFYKIQTNQNWCDVDTLAGSDLKNGERLVVEWPNGKTEKVTIKLESSYQVVSDMGRDTTIPIRKAYIKVKYKGFLTKVYIAGLKARRMIVK